MASNADSLAAAAISHEAAAGLVIEAKVNLIDAMSVSTSLELQCTSAESDSFKSPPSQEGSISRDMPMYTYTCTHPIYMKF